ncbi:MAG: SurA N-terminal domain-containing protein [Candidatus Shapirobacteria bacterium]|nr:SurA N-terminal domain-containing protein [Candidatus Shapirobacteria bacterium]MDD5073674.1 SurA N-terminal domain-containing protein [Candidatus Shapirobacteria bacterium]MDD5481436.1 SurA N-terminal domain-containing protein [Candidatus Shapirobacteria bacterium]
MAKIKTKTITPKAKESAKNLKAEQRKKTSKIVKKLPRFSRKTTVAFMVVLFLLGLFYFKRHWLVVATVNGGPIWRWQYNQSLEEQYGAQVLDQLVNKQLIQQKAKAEGVVVEEARIDEEIDQIRQSLGQDNSLEEILGFQGMTMASLREEIENQFIIEELLSAGIEISQEEIDQYLSDNEENIVAEDEEGRVDEAFGAIRMNKMNEKFQSWYQTLRDEAKIISFIGNQPQE